MWSPWIVAELHRVLAWDWMRKHGTTAATEAACSDAAKRMMVRLIPTFETVDPKPPYPPPWATLTDQWDHPVWAAAKIGRADYIVSENRRHFPPLVDGRYLYEGAEYLTGLQFLALLAEGIDD